MAVEFLVCQTVSGDSLFKQQESRSVTDNQRSGSDGRFDADIINLAKPCDAEALQ